MSACALVAAAMAACGNDSNQTGAFAVTAASIADGATGVATNASVGLTFNRAPLTSSVVASFTPSAAFTASYQDLAALFVPDALLAAGTAYTFTLTATDSSGQALAQPLVIHFTTADAGTGTDAGTDTTPPSAVIDLAVVPGSITATGLSLSFSAPGDDGATGTATVYEIRYLSGDACPNTEANFSSGTLVAPVAAPHAAGTVENVPVTGLTAGTSYCFRMRAVDEARNFSALSNVATATTQSAIATDGGTDGGTTNPPPDTTPPGPFTLTAENPTLTSIDVAFTDVGDDGDTGTAASYQLEYTAGPCSSTFDPASATQVTGLPAPRAPGTAELLTVPGLAPGQTYCIQLSIFDAAGNSSSASVTAKTADQNPVVTAVTPPDGSTGVSAAAPVTVAFSQPMDASTVTAQASAGPCSGSVQISFDVSFANCVAIGSVTPDPSGKAFSFAAQLGDGARYNLKVTAAALGVNGLPVVPFTTVNGFVTAPTPGGQCTSASPIVISQVYGGGGSPGAFYKQDFIELHNTSDTDFTIPDGGWSVQYAPPSEVHGWTAINQTILPAGKVIKAGGYLLLRELPGVNDAATPVPVGPDDIADGTIGLTPINAKVALVSSTTLLDGPCFTPGEGTVVDFVAYGAQFGTGACTVTTPALSNTTSAQRVDGCLDTGSNFTDFSVGTPAPRNSLSAPQACSCSSP